MTTVAIATKLATMNIVFSVTVATALAEPDFFFNRILVASDTFQCRVGPLKSELCPGIVIE